MYSKRLVIILSFVFCIIYHKSTAQDMIIWSENKKVEWQDFKATPDQKSKHSASINTGVKYTWKTKYSNGKQILSYEVFAYMIPSKSWVKSGKENDYILSHEQLHFDITELYARKIKKSFDEYTLKSSIKKDLKAIYDSLMQQRYNMQKQYDKETNHSIDTTNQKKWQLKIDELL